MSWTLCSSEAAVVKAGEHADATITGSNAALLEYSTQAEGEIEVATKRLWVDNYATLPTGIKGALGSCCSALVGMKIIRYNPNGYLTGESDMLMNANDEEAKNMILKLTELNTTTLQAP